MAFLQELLRGDDAADGKAGGEAAAEFVGRFALDFRMQRRRTGQERTGADGAKRLLDFDRGPMMTERAFESDGLRHDPS